MNAEEEIAASAAVAPTAPGTGEMAPGVVTALSSLVRRVVAPNPSLMTGPGTNSYLVGPPGGPVVAIDPGPDDEGHLDRLAEVGEGRIEMILVTHTHPDHSPGAAGLKVRTGAPVVGFASREGFEADQTVGDGWVCGVGPPLIALHTPGHASNHLCWLLEGERMLFSGDHIMNGSTVVIAPPDGDMAAYLAQLRRLKAVGLRSIAPGHGRLITDAGAKLDEYLAHRAEREQQIFDRLPTSRPGLAAGRTVEELVADIYTETPDALRPVARFSVWAHLRKLAAEGRVDSTDPDDREASWSARRA